MSDALFLLLIIGICFGTVTYAHDAWRSKKYADLFSIADDRWSCRLIAKALEIDSDDGDPGEYVSWAIRDELKARMVKDDE